MSLLISFYGYGEVDSNYSFLSLSLSLIILLLIYCYLFQSAIPWCCLEALQPLEESALSLPVLYFCKAWERLTTVYNMEGLFLKSSVLAFILLCLMFITNSYFLLLYIIFFFFFNSAWFLFYATNRRLISLNVIPFT